MLRSAPPHNCLPNPQLPATSPHLCLLPAHKQELLACYALIEKQGRGVVYYGSARLKQDSPHWERAVHLGRDVANLLGCTTWSGGRATCSLLPMLKVWRRRAHARCHECP